MKSKKIFFFIIIPLLLLSSFFFFKSLSNKKDSAEMVVHYISDDKLDSSDKVSFKKISFKPKDAKHRFILIDYNIELDLEKQKIMYEWITNGHVVVFYGNDIDSLKIPDKFNMPIPVTEKPVGTDKKFYFNFYGYGFSVANDNYMPLFHLTHDFYFENGGTLNDLLIEILLERKDF